MLKKRWWIPLLAILLVAGAAVPAMAGALTAGSYTYIFQGRELDVPVDIMTIQGDYMVPDDLLKVLGVAPQLSGDTIDLIRGPVDVQLTIGKDMASVNQERNEPLKAAPVYVSGRLFIPYEVLTDLGLSLTVDNKFVLLQDYGPGDGVPAKLSDNEYNRTLAAHTIKASLRTDSGALGGLTVTQLTADIVTAEQSAIPWGTRLKLLSMLETRTLLMVTIRNQSFRSVSLDPTKLLVTDDAGHQYDYQKTEIAVDGVVTSAMAPGAIRTSVLAYSKADGPVTLYYDVTSQSLGRVTGP